MIVTDQLGQAIRFDAKPQRIVSLVPSITELLYDLGAEEKLVGRTKFCIHPITIGSKVPSIGGTKNPKRNAIEDLRPDLIISNKEENAESDVRALQQVCPVYVSDVKTSDDTRDLIKSMGLILDAKTRADKLIAELGDILDGCKLLSGSVAYLIWKDPYMTIGYDTYIHHMLEAVGLHNVFGDQTRYPKVTIEMLKQARPDYIFLSSEPFPFKQSHIVDISSSITESRVILVDGEFFSWYGTRLLHKSGYPHELHKLLSLKSSLS